MKKIKLQILPTSYWDIYVNNLKLKKVFILIYIGGYSTPKGNMNNLLNRLTELC